MTTTDIYQAIAAFIGSITWSDVEAWLAYFGALLAVCTMLAAASLRGAKSLHAYALTTPTKSDEKVTAMLVRIAEVAGAALAFVAAWLPRITVGLGDARRALDAVKLPKPPRGAGALLILLVVLPLTSYSSGCATFASNGLRTVLMETDGYLDDINETVGERAAAAHEDAMDATEGNATPDEYDRLMRPWVRVERAIEGAQVTLLGVFTSSLAVRAGRDGDVLGAIGCTVHALVELTDLLPLVNLTVPKKLREAIKFLRGIAGAACPEPPADGEPEASSADPEGPS